MIILLKKNSNGSDVMEIQSILKKLGYYNDIIDGIYGDETVEAVKNFQEAEKIYANGEISPSTYKALEKYILGFTNYIIKPNDTLWFIAQKNNSTVNLIISANPGINILNLIPGTIIIIPYNYEIVPTDVNYTYEIMEKNIFGLIKRYPFLKIGSVGKSVLDKNLFMIKLGFGEHDVSYNASHHSLEWITSVLLMKFIERISFAYINNIEVKGYNLNNWFNNTSVHIVPMVNPDGVNLVNNGISVENPYYENLMTWNNSGLSFNQVWQANIRGVDLNHNYNALWELSVKAAESIGITGPAPTRYPGPNPESEPESRAMANFTRINNFKLVLAYHSQGEVIYWNFANMGTERDKMIGEELARVSGYVLDQSQGIASSGGYKDWFIYDFKRPGYTIEVGKGKNPLPIEQFDKIYNDNEELMLLAAVIQT